MKTYVHWWYLDELANLLDKSFRENQDTHFMFNNFFPKTCAIYEIMWKNMVHSDMPQMAI
jgi:hypothetical protein